MATAANMRTSGAATTAAGRSYGEAGLTHPVWSSERLCGRRHLRRLRIYMVRQRRPHASRSGPWQLPQLRPRSGGFPHAGAGHGVLRQITHHNSSPIYGRRGFPAVSSHGRGCAVSDSWDEASGGMKCGQGFFCVCVGYSWLLAFLLSEPIS